MQPIRTVIVDDEPLARDLLESYLLKLPGFEIVDICANALEAFSILSRQAVDLLLLDINMPEISGMDFLKTLKAPPHVIFTTAYAEYAVESYDFQAVDYLLKPITFSRFMKSIHKMTALWPPAVKPESKIAAGNNILFVKSEGKLVKVNTEELRFIEGYKNYVRLWTDKEKIIVHTTMKNIEDQFRQFPLFVRISKSFIINLKAVSEIDGNCVRIGNEMLAIGLTYRDSLKSLFEQFVLL